MGLFFNRKRYAYWVLDPLTDRQICSYCWADRPTNWRGRYLFPKRCPKCGTEIAYDRDR